MATSERKVSYSLRLREVCWGIRIAQGTGQRCSETAYIEKNCAERDSVESPEGAWGDGEDGGGSRSATISLALLDEMSKTIADSLVHKSQFTERVALDAGCNFLSQQ